MIYLPQNKPVTVNLSVISGNKKNGWWYDVQSGKAIKILMKESGNTYTFIPPQQYKDWVLVIDDASKHFKAPGIK